MGRAILLCVLFIGVFILACTKAPEKKELPVIEPNKFHIEYADGDTLLKQGKPITVSFNSSQLGDAVMHCGIMLPYNETIYESYEISSTDSIFSKTIAIPSDAQLANFAVYPNEAACGVDNLGFVELVHDENGVPVKNSYALLANYVRSDSVDFLEKELELYPDNVWIYLPTWSMKAYMDKNSIQQDIDKIIAMKVAQDETDAALAIANGYLGNKEKALEYFKKYMQNENAPWAPAIASQYAQLADFESNEEVDLLIDAMNQRVNSDLNSLPTNLILNKTSKPNDKFRTYLEKRFANDLFSCHMLSLYYQDIENDSAKAAGIADKIYNTNAQKPIPHDEQNDMAISYTLKLGAFIAYKTAEYEKAMKYAELAEKYITHDYFRAEIYHIIAKTSKALNDNEKFDKYLKMSIANGSLTDADKLIKELYPEQNSDSILAGIFTEAMEYNEKAPDYKFADIAGDTITPGNGRIQVIHFWGPGCKPCMDEKPALDEFGKELEDVDLYAVTGSVAYVKEHKLEFKNWQNIYDGSLGQAFVVNSIPRTYIVDQNGYVRFRKFGATEEYAEEKMVIDLLKKEVK